MSSFLHGPSSSKPSPPSRSPRNCSKPRKSNKARRRATFRIAAQDAAILKVAHFLDSQISGEMIHRWDGAFAIPSGWFARGLRDFSGPPEGAERQYRDGGFRSGGLRPVFHAKRVVSVVPAHPWPRAVELPDPVRDRENPLRQLHPRHARSGRSGAVATLFRARGAPARRAAPAPGLRQAGRPNPDRLGRNRVFLLAKARLPALPHAPTRQRQDRELSFPAGGDGGRPRPCQSRPAVSRLHRAARRCGKAGLRTQRRQALARSARRTASPAASRLSRRRSLRLPAHRRKCWRLRATISSSPARKARTRRSTISSTEPSPSITKKKSARARRSRCAVIAGSKAFRCASARTRRWSTGSGSRFSTATAVSNIPSPG